MRLQAKAIENWIEVLENNEDGKRNMLILFLFILNYSFETNGAKLKYFYVIFRFITVRELLCN